MSLCCDELIDHRDACLHMSGQFEKGSYVVKIGQNLNYKIATELKTKKKDSS